MRESRLLSHIYGASTDLGERVLVPPGDDMALLRLDGTEVLLAVDQVVDGRHFDLRSTPLRLIGRKAVARSLSDVAAMAGVPRATLVAATLPAGFAEDDARMLFDAMRDACGAWAAPLIGGDIAVHADARAPLTCSVTVAAEPTTARPITRSGAAVGDAVFVTGHLGGSLGADGLGRHLTFEPRLALGVAIAARLGEDLHAMIDLSDGLARDAGNIARSSRRRIELELDALPCASPGDWRAAVADGEDYELCFTTPASVPASLLDLPITHVGWVREAGAGPVVVGRHADGSTVDLTELGWEHGA